MSLESLVGSSIAKENDAIFPQYVSYRSAIHQLQNKLESCSRLGVHLFYFNIQPDELAAAHALLDKQPHRRAMRVTFSDDNNFIVKYMPSAAHETAIRFFDLLIQSTAQQLTSAALGDVGFKHWGSTTYQLAGDGRKEPDCCIVPFGIDSPTIVLEVGTSETLTQLRIDAKRWLEYDHLQVQMVILISIDPPTAPNLNNPQIKVEHWKAQPPLRPPCTANHRRKVASMVWSADWTLGVSPNYYILLADIFGTTPIPAMYGANIHLTFNVADVAMWRQQIIDSY